MRTTPVAALSTHDLRRELAAIADGDTTARLDLLHRLAWDVRNVDATESHTLASQALGLARSLGDERAEAFGLVARAYAAVRLSRGSEGIVDAERAVEMFRELGDPVGLPRALNTLGISYGDASRFMDALQIFLGLLTTCEESGDRVGEADALNNVGIVYVNLDDHSAALEYHMRSLGLARQIGYDSGEVRSLTNLGAVAYELARYEESVSYLQESIAKRAEGSNQHTYGITLVNLGRCYLQLGRHDEALEVLEQARDLLGKLDHSLGVAYALDSIGTVFLDRGDTAQALENLRASLAIKEGADDRKGQSTTLLHMAKGERQLGLDAAAEATLNQVLSHAVEVGARSEVYRAHQQLSEIFEQRGDLAKALAHHKTYNRVKDELFNDASDIKLRALRIGFEVEQAHKTNEIFRLKNVELAQANRELEVLARSLREADAQKSRLLKQVERQAREDALTGLGNRRHFDREINDAFPKSRRKRKPFSVALCDIDNFKLVNDSLGHAVGDRVLKIVAGLLKSSTRDQDVVARYGGEEFIAMLPDTNAATAFAICERMRQAVAEYDWSAIAPGQRVTISMGVSSDTRIQHHEKLISIADDHLYQAKAAGKNCVVGDAAAADGATDPGADAAPPRAVAKARQGRRADSSALLPGFTLRRAGQSLEVVTTQVGAVALLTSQPHLEVTEGVLDKGGRMTLVPDLGKSDAAEVYYVLEGTLTCELPSGSTDILAGDTVIVRALEQPVILTATTGARFLYVSSEPSFHQISQELDELRRLAVGVEFVDGYTAEHCGRLQATAYAIGEALDLPKHRLHLLDYAAYLHDVGKIRVPRDILRSPDALDEEGWRAIRRHPEDGAEMLAHTFMAAAAPIVAQHHERLDGSGYPLGLSGDQILIESHIVAVADTFDAMTSDRPYRAALSRETALEELRKLSGRTFPREVIEALEQVLPNLDP